MQEELRIAFFVIGIVFIVGILLHGAWTIRKNKKQNRPNTFQAARASEPRFERASDSELDDVDDFAEAGDADDIYDDVGVGQARVISRTESVHGDKDVAFGANPNVNLDTGYESNSDLSTDKSETKSVPILSAQDLVHSPLSPSVDDSSEADHVNKTAIEPDIKDLNDKHEPVSSSNLTAEDGRQSPVYSGVVTQPKPGFSKPTKPIDEGLDSQKIPEPPGFLLKKGELGASVGAADTSGDQNIKAQTSDDDTDVHLDTRPDTNAHPDPQTQPQAQLEPAPDFALDVQEGPDKPKDNVDASDTPKGVEKELSFAEQAKRFVTRRKKTVAEKIRKEPVVKANAKNSEDQMRIDFESASRVENTREEPRLDKETVLEDKPSSNTNEAAPQNDVLVLNVRASNDNPISGAALLPMLLTLGFKFGEHDIFHRHVNTNGKGPILFSLTNMFKPGVFDIDNIENFTTYGVSLFMMLPIEGDAQQVFNMMHNAARKIAEEFDCKILDANKVLISKQSLQQYSERIREFERRRLSR
ncbi:cell division protein ZipA [Glaciecola siphonariae]|uniref:Cell division protein ZipA n=1 Tax=Glaciecola siphonariae TaxID=521012 RepID=A0ABV9LRG9_9ALTE